MRDVLFRIPVKQPAAAKRSPRKEAAERAANHPGNPRNTPMRAENFTSPIPSFPLEISRIIIKMKGPENISRLMIRRTSLLMNNRRKKRITLPEITHQSGIILYFTSMMDAGMDTMINTERKSMFLCSSSIYIGITGILNSVLQKE